MAYPVVILPIATRILGHVTLQQVLCYFPVVTAAQGGAKGHMVGTYLSLFHRLLATGLGRINIQKNVRPESYESCARTPWLPSRLCHLCTRMIAASTDAFRDPVVSSQMLQSFKQVLYTVQHQESSQLMFDNKISFQPSKCLVVASNPATTPPRGAPTLSCNAQRSRAAENVRLQLSECLRGGSMRINELFE